MSKMDDRNSKATRLCRECGKKVPLLKVKMDNKPGYLCSECYAKARGEE